MLVTGPEMRKAMAAPAPEGSPGDLLTHGVDGDDDVNL